VKSAYDTSLRYKESVDISDSEHGRWRTVDHHASCSSSHTSSPHSTPLSRSAGDCCIFQSGAQHLWTPGAPGPQATTAADPKTWHDDGPQWETSDHGPRGTTRGGAYTFVRLKSAIPAPLRRWDLIVRARQLLCAAAAPVGVCQLLLSRWRRNGCIQQHGISVQRAVELHNATIPASQATHSQIITQSSCQSIFKLQKLPWRLFSMLFTQLYRNRQSTDTPSRVYVVHCSRVDAAACVAVGAAQMVRLDEVPEAFSGIAAVDRGESDGTSTQ
jgi:hypothetical protein